MSQERDTDDAEYDFFRTDGGDTVVYDPTNPEAWIQSTFSVTVGTTPEYGTSA